MKICIPSRGRASIENIRHGPLPLLPAVWQKDTILFVPNEEYNDYTYGIQYTLGPFHGLIMPGNWDNIAEKRTYIGQTMHNMSVSKFLMLDDDINFLTRTSATSASQHTMRDKILINEMLLEIEDQLDIYPQVALGLREVNKSKMLGSSPLLEECTKCMRAVAYQTEIFHTLKTNRVRTMSDYDTTLQILERGMKNAVLWWWMSGQKSTQAPGGCSVWRTHEVHNESIDRMVKLHPGLVTVRDKQTASGGDFGVRRELRIQWKKAYKQGLEWCSSGALNPA